MRILVGLGNPGERYARTRHNLGFRVVDRLAARYGMTFGPVADDCAAAEGRVAGVDTVLLKPMRYMNRSGEALARWAGGRGLALASQDGAEADAPLIVCDDIALPLGAARLRARGSDGGHRGLESILAALDGDEAFPRLRLGVAGDGESPPPASWSDYVLADFPAGEWLRSEELVDHACAALAWALVHGIEAAAGRFNRRASPDEAARGPS